MHIIVNREQSNDDTTISTVYLNGAYECVGLEDEYREVKVPGKTRIPSGVYNVDLRTSGGMHGRYSKAEWCKSWHQGMLWVRDVPNFEWIYIHPGNTHVHTEGCLLVGTKANDDMTISNSRVAYRRLYKQVVEAAKNGSLTIEYIDHDRNK